ncbi:MAG: DUF86 domain-containing protein [Flavobacterium sp.]|nr:DUF86 domain-containing protein [Flavobacterium sp.]
MQNNSKDLIRLKHILDSIVEIENYIENKNFADFQENSMLSNASIRLLEIIGEASNHLSLEIKTEFDSVEWKQIIGLRNILIHEYFAVDFALIWEVIIYDLPNFKNTIIKILNTLE